MMNSKYISFNDSIEINKIDLQDYFYENDLTDGLPVVIPHESKVKLFLSEITQKKDEIIGAIEPKKGIATVEKIFVNSIMAGCLPIHVPVIISIINVSKIIDI